MSIRNAIFAAAAHIEADPGLFNFGSVEVPHTCRTPGCAVGWILHFMGVDLGQFIDGRHITGPSECGITCSERPFYDGMDACCGDKSWQFSADKCAATLRKYADAHHPAWPSHPRERTQALGSWGDIAKLGWTPGVRA